MRSGSRAIPAGLVAHLPLVAHVPLVAHAALPALAGLLALAAATCPCPAAQYPDGRPEAKLRLEARDAGVVLRHGDGPGGCDALGARDVWVFESGGTTYLHYDGAGAKGWLCCLATSKDLSRWEKKGPILDLGAKGEMDSGSAAYGVTYLDGEAWHMFYLGTPNVSPAPDLIPSFPYLTLKAKGAAPGGPWTKQKDVVPFGTKAGTYYSVTASPGQVVKEGDEYLMFFSSTTTKPGNRYVQRTVGIARTKDLDGPWTPDPEPIVPIEEQVENASLYFEPACATWFLFTNHIGLGGDEYTDQVWVYWTRDLDRWSPEDKAVVLDGQNCTWSKRCIGLPSVLKVGKRLAVLYDAPGGDSVSHMRRDIGLAWLDLPLVPPKDAERAPEPAARRAQERAQERTPERAPERTPGRAEAAARARLGERGVAVVGSAAREPVRRGGRAVKPTPRGSAQKGRI